MNYTMIALAGLLTVSGACNKSAPAAPGPEAPTPDQIALEPAMAVAQPVAAKGPVVAAKSAVPTGKQPAAAAIERALEPDDLGEDDFEYNDPPAADEDLIVAPPQNEAPELEEDEEDWEDYDEYDE